ncbi:FAD-dependent oxidoreductase [bacterium]|nr:FAD-dependent oxidoreductase [bacterium]
MSYQELVKKPVASVMVVGAGIGGIQASLDLAESGFKVYLVESSPTIGGVMAQLDKTFPTNDCSMCIMSPKLVECGRHLNIENITYSEIEDISGQAGNFIVCIKRKSRFIDTTKCTGCAECEDVCPVKVPDEFNQELISRKAIYRPFPQAYPNAYTIEKNDISPCRLACPAGVNPHGYVALISAGKYKEALDLVRERIAFAAVCGRVCHHPCEAQCKRGEYDQPIAIRSLKRFLADWEGKNRIKDLGLRIKEKQRRKKEKVAIIGSGPAGLSCAYDLAREGYPVTVFEALPVAGGMLAVGIPEYRLPKNILNKEIRMIQDLGVEIKTNICIGDKISFSDLKNKMGYKAVFIAAGAHKGLKLGIPGEGMRGVLDCVAFLREANLGKLKQVKGKVAVIGGGNAAVDSARTALRLGASKVTIIYRRTRVEMPADEEEIRAAEKEGIDIIYLAAPLRIVGERGEARKVVCQKMKLGEPDDSGRRRPVPVPKTDFAIEIDMLIPAISQSPDLSFISGDHGIVISKWNTIDADADTCQTAKGGIFAGGDVTSGPGTVIEAIAAGKKAAVSIMGYLQGAKLTYKTVHGNPSEPDVGDYIALENRVRMPELNIKPRIKNFSEVELGFSEEDAKREAERCLNCGICSGCGECEKTCQANAIDHNMKDEFAHINIGSIILAPGFEEFNPQLKYDYGYSRFKNVISSIQFERILSASGPYEGHLLRPSDRKPPRRIAFLQCVGSRDVDCKAGYCSSVCCMYAIKEAIIAKEHSREKLDIGIFFMDMRAYGKDFDKYYERAKAEYGVRFIRSRVSEAVENKNTGNITLRYVNEEGNIFFEEFDLVVLSVGLKPSKKISNLARKTGIKLNQYNFCDTRDFLPLHTSKPGVFVCGAFSGPKDIPETVMGASGAAAAAAEPLFSVRGALVKEKAYPKELDIRGQGPRIGVFVCHCGINIGGVVDVKEVVEYAKTLSNVVYADENLYTCSQDTQQIIKDKIKEHGLNRVIVASCSPRTHEALFQETIKEAGLNPYLFEMGNIRDQCSWVHMKQPREATDKAKDLVKMIVAKSRFKRPLERIPSDIAQQALVIGGGVAGMTTALSIANNGFQTHLIEKEAELGGNLRNIYFDINGQEIRNKFENLRKQVQNNKYIKVYFNSHVEEIEGYVGNFNSKIKAQNSKPVEVKHGVVIVATGAEEYKPKEYLYGRDKRIVTQKELEHMISCSNINLDAKQSIVMIQCVGSRDDKRPYCSRVCCQQAIKNALLLKKINPEIEIYILYRDMRTYGFYEDAYREARDRGVIFLRYNDDEKPDVKLDNKKKLIISVEDIIVGKQLNLDTDLLVLSAGIIPNPENIELSQMMKVPLNEDRFFLEAHMKLRPVDFSTEGVFMCGLAHGPKNIRESIIQAYAAAGRACTVLAKKQIFAEGTISVVDETKCDGCGLCVEVCAYKAIEIDEERSIAVVNSTLCKGCGACSASCRPNAITVSGFTDEQILAQIDAL